MRVLITGGAGYIGSHVVRALNRAGHDTIVYDNLSTGKRGNVTEGAFICGDVEDVFRLRLIFGRQKIDAVVHLAASVRVDESISAPYKYYLNNMVKTLGLVEMMIDCGVNKLIFASTAAVYGDYHEGPKFEDEPCLPYTPYGKSKYYAEEMIRDLAAVNPDFNYIIFRFFNVAGADPAGDIGQSCNEPTHLIARCLQAAKGQLDSLPIYGRDYPTPDGTAIRDYIHVNDIADAVTLALANNGKGTFNLGYGSGYSVLEVVEAVRKVTGIDIKVDYKPRRDGDAIEVIANNERACHVLNWEPKFADIEYIIKTAWEYENGL